MDELRLSAPGDEAQLKKLWARVFGDTEETIDGFFETLYAPGTASVYVRGGRVVSAAYLVKLGELVCGGRRTPCKAVYAYGTDPDFRGRGFGGKVLRHALDRAASGVAAVRPAQPSLFDYYERFGFSVFFLAEEGCREDDGRNLSGSVVRVTAGEYAALREELLQDRAHVDFDVRALEYQELLCRQSGGGLYGVAAGGERCCAAVEIEGDEAKIRELLAPAESGETATLLVCRAVRRAKCSCRAPASRGGAALPFAMLAFSTAPPPPDAAAPWLGFDFG